MKTWIGTEAAMTADLTAEEFGAYERLRRFYWQHNGLPNDDRRLMRITGVDPDRWDVVRSGICSLFEEGWRLPALDAERETAAEKRDRAIERSQRAANARWGKTTDARSNASSNARSIAASNASSMLGPMPEAMLEECPSASASEEVRYDERLSLTHAHAHERTPAREEPATPPPAPDPVQPRPREPADPDMIPVPASETAGREWLRARGCNGMWADNFLPRLMAGRLSRAQLDHVVSR